MEKQSRKEFLTTTAATAGVAAAATFGFRRPALAQADESNQITQIVTLTLKEGSEEAGIAALKTLADAVEANEPGVLAYEFNQSLAEPTKLIVYEVYKDERTLAAHGRKPHMAAAGAAFGQYFDMSRFKVDRVKRVAGFIRLASR